MRKKMLGVAVIFAINMLSVLFVNAEEIKIGDYVQMGIYYNEPILWRCIDIDKNGPLMLSDKILCLKAFDARGNNMTGSHKYGEQYFDIPNDRAFYGSNYWADSTIRSWLNSNADAGHIQWLCGNAPSEVYFDFDGSKYDIRNPYDKEAGFLTNFSNFEKKAIKEVIQKSIVSRAEYENGIYTTGEEPYKFNGIGDESNNYDIAFAEYVSDKMFLLDERQIEAIYDNSDILGENYHIGIPTDACIANCDFGYSDCSEGQPWRYYLRMPWLTTGIFVVDCLNDSNFSRIGGDDTGGIRPAFYLDLSSSNISGYGTKLEPYTVQNIEPCFETDENAITNKSDRERTATIIIAEYNGNELRNVTSTKETFSAGQTKTFTIPQGGKIFVWDSFEGMKPLAE